MTDETEDIPQDTPEQQPPPAETPTPSDGDPKLNGKITSKDIQDCLYAGELGDGTLFAAVHRGRFLYNNMGGEWLKWTGHTWSLDIMQEVMAGAEDVVDCLLEHASEVSKRINWAVKKGDETLQERLGKKRESIYKRIAKYRTDKGRNAMIKFARTCKEPLAIRGDELDLHPWLFPCANGIIDLRTGKFRDGRPDEYLSKASPIEWKGLDTLCKEFDKWILEVLSGDEELVAFLRRALGYAITGLSREHILLVLWGGGRNGKGTLVDLVSHVLGPLAGPIQAEMLLDQGRARNSAGPSPDIMALRGLRVAFASETDEGRRFSPARVKWLTGGDALVGRHPHDKHEVHFQPTHTLILLTNNKPGAPDTDFAFWQRVRLIPFKLAFVDREPSAVNEKRAVKGIADDLKAEASGILAWLVRGCLEYQERGLDPPLAVREATADWQKAENEILDFLEEYCERDEILTVKATKLYENFNRWYKANRNPKGISQAMFGRIMGKRFERKKVEGIMSYIGLKLTQEVPEPEGEGKEESKDE